MSSLLDESQQQQQPLQPQARHQFPATRVLGGECLGRHTQIVLTQFKDRTLLAVTQLNKIGTICQVVKESVGGVSERKGAPVYSCEILLGEASEAVTLLGRLLAERLGIEKPLLLTTAVKGLQLEQVKTLAEFVLQTIN